MYVLNKFSKQQQKTPTVLLPSRFNKGSSHCWVLTSIYPVTESSSMSLHALLATFPSELV